MNYTSHYDGDNFGYSAQDNQYLSSPYLVDTSTLTLSEVPHPDGSFFHDFSKFKKKDFLLLVYLQLIHK